MESNRSRVGSRDAIAIEGLDVECIIGLWDHERVTPQRLVVDVLMSVDTQHAVSEERLDKTVDYEWVSWQIAFILKLGKFGLLEAAAHAIVRALLLAPVAGEARCAVSAVELSLRKPAALAGRGVPSLRIARSAETLELKQETKPFGTVDIILETKDVGLYRLNVLPGRQIAMHVHREMQEAELVLSSELHCQGVLACRGSVRQWPFALPHHYENRSDVTQSILCIDRPPFIEVDEVPSAEAAGAMVGSDVWRV